MQSAQSIRQPRLTAATRDNIERLVDPSQAAPLTPAVTGINYPSPTDVHSSSGARRPSLLMEPSRPSSYHQSSSNGSDAPSTPTDMDTLDQLWRSIRLQKERKMAKEPPKVQLFADMSYGPDQPSSSFGQVTVEPQQHIKKQKSLATFRESADGQMMTAKFDMPGIKKQDVHVSFQRTRLVVTWQTVTTDEREEDGHIIRERREKTYSQNIPLPEGARFEQVRAAMDGRKLMLRYPSMHSDQSASRTREYA